LPTAAPNICYANPTEYGCENLGFPIDDDLAVSLMESFAMDAEYYEYLPLDVRYACDQAMEILGNPRVELGNAWDIFGKLLQIILILGRTIQESDIS
jgi:hypothetical protein